MAAKKKDDAPKESESVESAEGDAPKDNKEEAPRKGLSPREDKSLPQGIYGGPATVNNPAPEFVVIRAEDRK